MGGYIFYDTETTGLAAGFDQIVQFAAVVTDDDLSVVEEVDLRCRLQAHILPSPGALAITGLSPSDIAAAPLSHYEMVREIRALVSRQSPVVMIGFNSLGYDEGMLRQALFQTLNPVYLTNTGGNTRMDLLRVAHAVAHHAPDVLIVPTTPEGRPTFRLELLAAANGLMHDQAHDALSDTRATLELARLIRSKAPKVWEAMRQMRSKQLVELFLSQHSIFACTNTVFAASTIMAGQIATNPDNPSEVAVFDLAYDPGPMLDMEVEGILAALRDSPRLIRVIRTNNQPILLPLEGGADEVSEQRLEQIAAHPTFSKKVAQAIAQRYPDREPPLYVEQRIYEGFPCRADRNLMEQFHKAPWQDRFQIVCQMTDKRLRILGQRLIYLEHPNLLPADIRAKGDAWRRDRWLAPHPVPWMTVEMVKAEMTELKNATNKNAPLLLEMVEAYLARLSDQAGITQHTGNSPPDF